MLNRKFVFLQPEDRGYGLKSRDIPKGHIEIEKKQKNLIFKVFVENMKPMEYHIRLYSSTGDRIYLGVLLVEDMGKGAGEYTLDKSNAKNSTMEFDNFGIITIEEVEDVQKIKTPLIGWIQNEKFEYKKFQEIENKLENKKEFKKQKPMEEKIQPIEEVERVEEIQEEGQEKLLEEVEEVEEAKEVEREPIEEQEEQEEQEEKDDNIEKKEDTIIEKEKGFKNQKEEQESNEEMYMVDFEFVNFEEDKNIDREIRPPYYYINDNIKDLEKVVTPIEPFKIPMKQHKWWKITGYEKELEKFHLSFNNSFVPLTYPFMKFRNIGEVYAENYNHWIFGVTFKEDIQGNPIQYFVYGIPGRFCAQEQPFQGGTGYLYWHPVENTSRKKPTIGYWLLYVDAKSGDVVVPKPPTMPPLYKY